MALSLLTVWPRPTAYVTSPGPNHGRACFQEAPLSLCSVQASPKSSKVTAKNQNRLGADPTKARVFPAVTLKKVLEGCRRSEVACDTARLNGVLPSLSANAHCVVLCTVQPATPYVVGYQDTTLANKIRV